MHSKMFLHSTHMRTRIRTFIRLHATRAHVFFLAHSLARSPFLTNTRTKKRSCSSARESDGPPSLVYHLTICTGLCARVYTCECIHAHTYAHTHTHERSRTNTTIHKSKYIYITGDWRPSIEPAYFQHEGDAGVGHHK